MYQVFNNFLVHCKILFAIFYFESGTLRLDNKLSIYHNFMEQFLQQFIYQVFNYSLVHCKIYLQYFTLNQVLSDLTIIFSDYTVKFSWFFFPMLVTFNIFFNIILSFVLTSKLYFLLLISTLVLLVFNTFFYSLSVIYIGSTFNIFFNIIMSFILTSNFDFFLLISMLVLLSFCQPSHYYNKSYFFTLPLPQPHPSTLGFIRLKNG